jgi:hypothetical protein
VLLEEEEAAGKEDDEGKSAEGLLERAGWKASHPKGALRESLVGAEEPRGFRADRCGEKSNVSGAARLVPPAVGFVEKGGFLEEPPMSKGGEDEPSEEPELFKSRAVPRAPRDDSMLGYAWLEPPGFENTLHDSCVAGGR